MLVWLQAPLELLLSAERTFWDFCDATVWFDVSYHSNVPSEPSFRVAPFAASHRPVEDRLALGRRAWRTPEKLPLRFVLREQLGRLAGEQLGRRAPTGLVLKIHVGERLPVVVADDGAGVSRLTFG